MENDNDRKESVKTDERGSFLYICRSLRVDCGIYNHGGFPGGYTAFQTPHQRERKKNFPLWIHRGNWCLCRGPV